MNLYSFPFTYLLYSFNPSPLQLGTIRELGKVASLRPCPFDSIYSLPLFIKVKQHRSFIYETVNTIDEWEWTVSQDSTSTLFLNLLSCKKEARMILPSHLQRLHSN